MRSAASGYRLVCPLLSTVTYLDDLGAPTLILEQASTDGTREMSRPRT